MAKTSRRQVKRYSAPGIKKNLNRSWVPKGYLTSDRFVHKLITDYGMEVYRHGVDFFLNKHPGVKRVVAGRREYLLIPKSALRAYVEKYRGYSLAESKEIAKLKKSLRNANNKLMAINSDQELKARNLGEWNMRFDAAQKKVYELGKSTNEMEKGIATKNELRRLKY